MDDILSEIKLYYIITITFQPSCITFKIYGLQVAAF